MSVDRFAAVIFLITASTVSAFHPYLNPTVTRCKRAPIMNSHSTMQNLPSISRRRLLFILPGAAGAVLGATEVFAATAVLSGADPEDKTKLLRAVKVSLFQDAAILDLVISPERLRGYRRVRKSRILSPRFWTQLNGQTS